VIFRASHAKIQNANPKAATEVNLSGILLQIAATITPKTLEPTEIPKRA
jgi:hypothetical protein